MADICVNPLFLRTSWDKSGRAYLWRRGVSLRVRERDDSRVCSNTSLCLCSRAAQRRRSCGGGDVDGREDVLGGSVLTVKRRRNVVVICCCYLLLLFVTVIWQYSCGLRLIVRWGERKETVSKIGIRNVPFLWKMFFGVNGQINVVRRDFFDSSFAFGQDLFDEVDIAFAANNLKRKNSNIFRSELLLVMTIRK